MDDFPVYGRRPSCDTLALAMCDPGLRRRHSSECEEDSLPDVYVDSGLSTLRGSHGGYDSELEVKGQEEEDGGLRVKKKLKSGNRDSLMGETCDVEVRRSPRVAMFAHRYPWILKGRGFGGFIQGRYIRLTCPDLGESNYLNVNQTFWD